MKIENFCCAAAELQNKMTGTTKMSQIYYYRAYEEETLADMLTTGFFNNIQDRVKKDDIIILYQPNTNSIYQVLWVKVTSNHGGIVTVEEISLDPAAAAKIAAIEAKIPEEASATNQLADKDYVNTLLQGKQDVLTSDNAGTNITITNEGGIVKINSTASGGGAVDSVNGQTGVVVLTASDVGAQETLVSGTNIKTINGQSLLGSGNIPIIGNIRNIGEIIESTIPLTDAGIHLLDGALLSGSGSYADFVDYIAGLYNSGNYTAIFETEANWQTSVTTYGVCGKYVYDSVNNTVRLPKIFGFTEGTIDPTVIGDLTEAGLPNITGTIPVAHGNATPPSPTGAFTKKVETWSARVGSGASDTWGDYYDLDASISSSKYGNSNTVQPQSIKVMYYVVIATLTKTNIEVDIDEIATDLNGKADRDLSNCTKPHVVTTYKNGLNWYRIWSDGWIEQGGFAETSSVNVVQGVTFLTPFSDNAYTSFATVDSFDGDGYNYFATTAQDDSTGAKLTIYTRGYAGTVTAKRCHWYACGY